MRYRLPSKLSTALAFHFCHLWTCCTPPPFIVTDPAQAGTVVVGYDRGTDESDKSIFPNSLQAADSAGRLFTETLQRRGAIEPALFGGASDQNADGLMTIGRYDRGSVKDGIASRFIDTSYGRFSLWAGGMAGYSDVDPLHEQPVRQSPHRVSTSRHSP